MAFSPRWDAERDTPFPIREEIARLAYAYSEERGRPFGSTEED
jgi:hypothetical protein